MENKISAQDDQNKNTLSQNDTNKEELEKKDLLYTKYAASLACYNAFRRNVYSSLYKTVKSGAQIAEFGCSSKVDDQGDTIISFAFAGGVEPVAKRYKKEKLIEMQHELQDKLKYLYNPQASATDLKHGETYVLVLVEAFVTNLFSIHQMDWINSKLN